MGDTLQRHSRCCASFILSVWLNVSEVANYVTTGSPPPFIAPYPRPFKVGGVPDSSCGNTDYPLCGPWTTAERPAAATSPNVLHDWNVLEPQETPDEKVTICVAPGHKVVQAQKAWHGMKPFGYCPGESCPSIGTRYRTVKRHTVLTGHVITYEADGVTVHSTTAYNHEMLTQFTVDRYSGKISLDDCSLGASSGGIDAFFLDVELQLLRITQGCTVELIFTDTSPNYSFADLAAFAAAAEWTYTQSEPAVEREVTTTASGADDEITGTFNFEEQTYTLTGLGVRDKLAQDMLVHIEFSVNLTNPYDATGADSVESDCKGLLSQWELGQLEWRDTESIRSLGVRCLYHEPSAQTPDVFIDTCSYTDTSDYTGVMYGTPFDGSIGTNGDGHSSMFGFDHVTHGCLSEAWYEKYFGAYSGESSIDTSDYVIPKNASAWTNNYEAGLLYPGSWYWWTTIGTDGAPNELILQKQCEGTIAFPSYNLFGPCGAQRHEPDTAKASCIAGYSGVDNDAILEDAIGDGTYDVIVFGAGPAKRFSVTVTGTTAVFNSEDTNARGVDDAVAFWVNVPDIVLGSGIMAAVRDWKRSAVSFAPPAICGKISITSAVQDGADVVVTLGSTAPYLQIGDKVIFVQGDAADTVNDDNGGAGYTINAQADPVFKFTGTLNSGTMTGYLKSLGAPAAKWNSTASRGNFVWQSCPFDSATGGFDSPTFADDRYSGAKILGSTPNGDTTSEWVTDGYTGYTFPSVADPTSCGAQALVIPVQYVTDPLYQVPFGCVATSVCVRSVEAMTSTKMAAYVTAGAPALPDGCSFSLPSNPSPLGSTCSTGQPIPFPAPWNLCTSV